METGVLLSLEDCKTLFPRLKDAEARMSGSERAVLLEIERYLYANLSVLEVEELLEKR